MARDVGVDDEDRFTGMLRGSDGRRVFEREGLGEERGVRCQRYLLALTCAEEVSSGLSLAGGVLGDVEVRELPVRFLCSFHTSSPRHGCGRWGSLDRINWLRYHGSIGMRVSTYTGNGIFQRVRVEVVLYC